MTPFSGSPLVAAFLAGLSLYLLLGSVQGGLAPRGLKVNRSKSGSGLAMAVLSIAAAVYLLGLIGGLIVVAAIAIHEYGHVAAYRAAGHSDAFFRLVPFLGGVAISRQSPRDQISSYYVSLMGPGFSLAPLVVCIVAGVMTENSDPELSYLAWRAAAIVGFLNAFNLLPFWPLDGGRMVRAITVAVAPSLARNITIAMTLGLIVLSVMMGWWLIGLFAMISLPSIKAAEKADEKLRPMSADEMALAVAAYVATFAAHLWAGFPILLQIAARGIG